MDEASFLASPLILPPIGTSRGGLSAMGDLGLANDPGELVLEHLSIHQAEQEVTVDLSCGLRCIVLEAGD